MDVAKVEKNILMLNDDCLYLIFSHFTLMEVIEQLEKVCQRFRDIAENVYKTYYVLDCMKMKNSLFDDRVSFTSTFGKVSERVQPYVVDLRVDMHWFYIGLPDLAIMAVVVNYKNLEHLDLKYISCVMKNLPVLTEMFKNLKTARLEHCRITDRIGVCLEGATKLQSLDLSHNLYLHGGFLLKLQNVQKLVMINCEGLKPHHFIDFCRIYRKLKSLNIRSCDGLDMSCMDALTLWQQQLQEMEIDKLKSIASYQVLADLPNLTHLTLICSDILTTSVMQGLVARDKIEFLRFLDPHVPSDVYTQIIHFTKLKVLTLIAMSMDDKFLKQLSCHNTLREAQIGSQNITDAGILHLIKVCPMLEYLNVSYCKMLQNKELNSVSPTCFVSYKQSEHIFRHALKLND
ncbi:hypothetical protein DMENIID0001_154650 [Sergentomyia squamirostris]